MKPEEKTACLKAIDVLSTCSDKVDLNKIPEFKDTGRCICNFLGISGFAWDGDQITCFKDEETISLSLSELREFINQL